MELTIDQRRAIMGEESLLIPTLNPSAAGSVAAQREGRTMEFTLPRCPENDALLGRPFDPSTATRFNAIRHTATLTEQGSTLFSGTIRLLSASDEGYRIELREGGSAWATEAAELQLHQLEIDYERPLTPETIHHSWSNDDPVRFFPIHRDSYESEQSSHDLLPAERILSTDDYHPFLHIETLVRATLAASGYHLESRFMESPLFRSLYMSGAYATADTSSQASRMGFRAARLSDATATANSVGRVYTNPFMVLNSVGNLVESATPQSLDATGKAVANLYNNGNCFTIDDEGAICYTPRTAATIGFEYHLRYTTQHRICSRTRLTGFDSIYLGSGNEFRFTLANRYIDRRGTTLNRGQQYRIIVFDHQEGDAYHLRYTSGSSSGVLWCGFSGRTTLATTPSSLSVSNPTLEVLRNNEWVAYEGDWAIYDGYVEEEGKTLVELRLRTAAEPLGPTSPKRFDNCYLFGADPGMQLTLHSGTTIESYFRNGPGYGATLRFADVAQHPIRPIELLEALAHLFNLRFETDESLCRVRIEPFDDFYRTTPVDWSEAIDHDHPVTLTDLTTRLHSLRTWCYAESDGVVRRFEQETDTVLGSWSHSTDSAATLHGHEILRNNLFAPTVSSTGHYTNAPSAQLLQIGDRDLTDPDALTISPRIVSYCGLHSLAEGERWGYPSDEGFYPLARFHFAGDEESAPVNLGFEDRDGVEGLHRFYDRELRHLCYGGLVELTLSLPAHRYEALMTPDSPMGNLRSTFRLTISEGEAQGILYRVGPYNPITEQLTCTFLRTDRTL